MQSLEERKKSKSKSDKKYRLKNREKIRKIYEKWYEKNQDKMIKKSNDWYYNNIEKAKERSKAYRIKNREKILEDKKLWSYNNRWIKDCILFKKFWERIEIPLKQKVLRNKKIECTKIWRSKNKEHIKQYDSIHGKKYYWENREKLLKRGREYGVKNREKIKIRNQKYRKENPEKIKLRKQKDYRKNWEKYQKWGRMYYEKNPEKFYRQNIKQLKKLSIPFKLPHQEYLNALISWTKTVRKTNGNYCAVCGSAHKLNSHHILHKAKYPELSLNLNNGIPLCKIHHREVHGWFIK